MLGSNPIAQLSEAPIGRRERRAVTVYGFAVRQDGSTASVSLTDLSNGGCGLETTASLKPGERIELSIPPHGTIVGSVRWCANGRAGVTFESTLAAPKRISRRSERWSLAAEVTLRRTGRASFRVTVLDISSYGCRLDVVDRPEVNERVWVKFGGLDAIESTVCWVDGFKIGIEYANPMHPAVFDQLLNGFHGSAPHP